MKFSVLSWSYSCVTTKLILHFVQVYFSAFSAETATTGQTFWRKTNLLILSVCNSLTSSYSSLQSITWWRDCIRSLDPVHCSQRPKVGRALKQKEDKQILKLMRTVVSLLKSFMRQALQWAFTASLLLASGENPPCSSTSMPSWSRI